MIKVYLSEQGALVIEGETRTYVPEGHRLWVDIVQPYIDAHGPLVDEPVVQVQQTQEEYLAAMDRAIEAWLDRYVQARNYKDIQSCISYVGDEDPYFAAEGLAAKRWRSAVYRAARAHLLNPPAGVTPGNVTTYLPQPEEFGWPENQVGAISQGTTGG